MTSAIARFSPRRSHHVGGAASRVSSYQRLEFLGDRVLGMAVAAMLMDALSPPPRRVSCRDASPGWCGAKAVPLSPRRGRSSRSSVSPRASGGRCGRRSAGDICEAIIGAVFLDGGFRGGAGPGGARLRGADARAAAAPRCARSQDGAAGMGAGEGAGDRRCIANAGRSGARPRPAVHRGGQRGHARRRRGQGAARSDSPSRPPPPPPS